MLELAPQSGTIEPMNTKAKVLLEDALRLSESDRAEIAGALLESIEPDTDVAVEEAWREEVKARVAALESGEVQTVPWEEVRDRLFRRLSSSRAR